MAVHLRAQLRVDNLQLLLGYRQHISPVDVAQRAQVEGGQVRHVPAFAKETDAPFSASFIRRPRNVDPARTSFRRQDARARKLYYRLPAQTGELDEKTFRAHQASEREAPRKVIQGLLAISVESLLVLPRLHFAIDVRAKRSVIPLELLININEPRLSLHGSRNVVVCALVLPLQEPPLKLLNVLEAKNNQGAVAPVLLELDPLVEAALLLRICTLLVEDHGNVNRTVHYNRPRRNACQIQTSRAGLIKPRTKVLSPSSRDLATARCSLRIVKQT